jgi:hypothetical protein
MSLRPVAVIALAGAVVFAAPAAGVTEPKLRHARLIYRGGPDDPVAVGFKTTGSISTQSDGTIRARVAIRRSSTSVFHLRGRRCYEALASVRVVNHLKVGHRYTVEITIGAGANERRYERKLTLRRSSERAMANAMHC